MKTFNIPKLNKPTTVVQFLLHHLQNYNKQKAENIFYKNQVLVNDEIVSPEFILKENDILKIVGSERKIDEYDSDFDAEIIFENEEFLVVNKPEGMACHAGLGVYKNTLLQTLNKHYKNKGINEKVYLVHRLDKATSGLMVLAKNNPTLQKLQTLFGNGKVQKKYMALVHGKISLHRFEVQKNIGRDNENPKIIRTFDDNTSTSSVINGKFAHTFFKVIQSDETKTLVSCQPITGRTHQIRLHLLSVGHPIIGDRRYFLDTFKNTENSRMYLHAEELSFDWKDEVLHFQSNTDWQKSIKTE